MCKKLVVTGIAIALLSLTLSGCTTVGEAMNPYKSQFHCPFEDKGKCGSMTSAYEESTGKNGKTNMLLSNNSSGENKYQEAVYKKLSGLINEPETPVIAPPKVMRVLMLPYKGSDKELFLDRWVYFVADEYEWVLSNNYPIR